MKDTRTDRPAYRLTVKEGEREEEVSWNDSFEVHALVAHRFLFVKNAVLCKKKMCSSSRIRDPQSCIELVDLLVALQAKFRLLAAGVADGSNGRQNLSGSFRIYTSDRA